MNTFDPAILKKKVTIIKEREKRFETITKLYERRCFEPKTHEEVST